MCTCENSLNVETFSFCKHIRVKLWNYPKMTRWHFALILVYIQQDYIGRLDGLVSFARGSNSTTFFRIKENRWHHQNHANWWYGNQWAYKIKHFFFKRRNFQSDKNKHRIVKYKRIPRAACKTFLNAVYPRVRHVCRRRVVLLSYFYNSSSGFTHSKTRIFNGKMD